MGLASDEEMPIVNGATFNNETSKSQTSSLKLKSVGPRLRFPERGVVALLGIDAPGCPLVRFLFLLEALRLDPSP